MESPQIDGSQSRAAAANAPHALPESFLKYIPTIQTSLESETLLSQTNLKSFLARDHVPPTDVAASQASALSQPDDSKSVAAFLASTDGDIQAPAGEEDLSHPMSHYFISSSHNTYLTGNQLYSNASVDGYMKALKVGCRCVEIDVWDGKESEEDKVEDEVGHIEERLRHLDGRSASHDPSEKDTSSHRGLRAKLGLRKSSASKSGLISATRDKAKEKTKQKLGDASMPTPWKASSEPEPEPRVLHGHTLTKEVSFRFVCKAIAATAFISSDLPVIASLEVHCSLEQQGKMVEIMWDVWRDYLLDVSRYATGHEPEYTAPLPSPEALRNKILIKVKYTPPEKASKKNDEKNAKEDSGSSDEDEEDGAGDQLAQSKPEQKKKILDALSLLGVYTRSFHFKSFQQKEAQIPTHVFALSENKIKEAIEDQSVALSRHNRKYFLRAYPKGVRVSSSNLNPIRMWRHGVQMVALNWQSCDKAIMLNEGMFGGTQGWVLKPQSYWDQTMTPPADANTMPGKSADALTKPSTQEPTASDRPDLDEVARDLSQTSTQASMQKTQSSSSTTNNLSEAPSQVSTLSAPTMTHDSLLSPTHYLPPKHLSLSITFYAGQDLPLPEDATAKHFKPYIKVILHTEAVPSQHASRSHSHSRATSPQPAFQSGRHIGNAKESAQSARARATSLLQAHKKARRPSDSTPHDGHGEKETSPPSTKAKARHKAETTVQRGNNPDFHAETVHFENAAVDTEAEYMTFVRIKLMHEANIHKDELAGWACIRLGRLRKGWGVLRLKTAKGEDAKGRVLVRVGWTLEEGRGR